MIQPSVKWRIQDASTGIASASLDIFSTGGFGGKTRSVVVQGFMWGTASSMSSTDYFRIVAQGTTALVDPVGARFSGGDSADGMIGLGIVASSQLTASFSATSPGGALQSFSVWGYYE